MSILKSNMIDDSNITGFADSHYSIHTMELSVPLVSRYECMGMITLLKDTLGINWNRTSELLKSKPDFILLSGNPLVWHFGNHNLFPYGIWDVTVRQTSILEGYYYYKLSFKVNPRALMGHKEYPYICIVPTEDLPYIMNALKEILWEHLRLPQYYLDSIYLSRVDFCANILMDSQEDAERYMKLLQQFLVPRGMKLKQRYDAKQKRWVIGDNGFELKGKQNDISIYLKYNQMKNRIKNYGIKYSQEELEASKGQIRFEVRLKRQKILYTCRRISKTKDSRPYDTEQFTGFEYDKSPEAFLGEASSQAQRYMENFLRMMYGKGNFYSLSEAKRIIRSSNSYAKTKYQAEKLLDMVSIHKGLRNSLTEISQLIGTHETQAVWQYCRAFSNKWNVSLVTIPRSWGISQYENPISYIKTRNVNQRTNDWN